MHSVLATTTFPPFTLNLWQDLQTMLGYDFMRNALLAGTVISLLAGFVGYFVVLRHQAFASESLSDVAFTGALAGAVLGINPLVTLLFITVAVALAMGGLGERLQERDVATGTILAWVLGLGALCLSKFTTQVSGTGTGFSAAQVLFGNMLGISSEQLVTLIYIGVPTLLVLSVIARPLLFASLDPVVAAARRVPVRVLGLIFVVLLAITVSEATMAVGALLVFALILLPAAIAHRLTSAPFVALALSIVIAILLTWVGITLGFYTGYPISVCISLPAFICYAAAVGGFTLMHRRLLLQRQA
ncbi:metal ABC transporter permease [Dictyobacter formicarum]|uniref:ABC transporter permease n=1 Tax=Dictyobacter formicarum TaxID=2778368 RepID=A0ABQ3VEK4_9CHLR|nr:metal ABC transporter permease [Dictyobacter formicarum]GHO84083.1 ABC transporter permease [Dictyobacter formicarum]